MGPDYSQRYEEFHGLDRHPNGLPPEEKPPKFVFPVDCPKCGGTGGEWEDDIPTGDYSHPVPCGMCEGWGTVEFASKVRF